MADIKELYFSKEHEWVRYEKDKAYIGITDYAQQQLGDIVFIEMPEVGQKISAGGQIGVVESVKAVSDIFCPVSGSVIEINDGLESSPELLNADPYKNHIFVLNLDDPSELDSLLSYEEYDQYCGSIN